MELGKILFFVLKAFGLAALFLTFGHPHGLKADEFVLRSQSSALYGGASKMCEKSFTAGFVKVSPCFGNGYTDRCYNITTAVLRCEEYCKVSNWHEKCRGVEIFGAVDISEIGDASFDYALWTNARYDPVRFSDFFSKLGDVKVLFCSFDMDWSKLRDVCYEGRTYDLGLLRRFRNVEELCFDLPCLILNVQVLLDFKHLRHAHICSRYYSPNYVMDEDFTNDVLAASSRAVVIGPVSPGSMPVDKLTTELIWSCKEKSCWSLNTSWLTELQNLHWFRLEVESEEACEIDIRDFIGKSRLLACELKLKNCIPILDKKVVSNAFLRDLVVELDYSPNRIKEGSEP